MTDANLNFETFGKWILAGEHAVLRGVPALVFPAKDFKMIFSFKETQDLFSVNFSGKNGDEIRLIFWGLIEYALEKIGRERNELHGHLDIKSTLPLGAGLGASAALCVGVARIFAFKKWIAESDIYEFSRELESLFHGESSGVDIAIAIEARPLKFMRGGERTPLQLNWMPEINLTYSGMRGATSDCVKKVNDLVKKNPQFGEKIDAQMREAVELAERALALDKETGVSMLAHAIDLARDCFYQWGLCEGELDQHMRELTRAGALAVKPTGSGGGGYVLSFK